MRDFVSCTTRCTVLPQRSCSENVARYGDMNKHPVETKCSLVIVLTNSRHSDSFIHSFVQYTCIVPSGMNSSGELQ